MRRHGWRGRNGEYRHLRCVQLNVSWWCCRDWRAAIDNTEPLGLFSSSGKRAHDEVEDAIPMSRPRVVAGKPVLRIT
jgi:hypothetical protein